jgi:predicted nucleotidyltransferase
MADQIPKQLLAELNKELRLIYGNQLFGVYLFGSYARGEQDPEIRSGHPHRVARLRFI